MNLWTVPVIHPAATFRTPAQLGPLEAHVYGYLKRSLFGMPAEPVLEISPTLSRLKYLVAECKRRRTALAVDVESSPPLGGRKEWALLPQYAALRAVGVGAAIGPGGLGLSWFYPCPRDIWLAFKAAMADRLLVKVFCNGQAYDIPMLKRHGVVFAGPIEDIRDGRRVLSSTSRTALDVQASIYLECGPWKVEAKQADDETDDKGYLDASRIPKAKLLRYNAEDCVRTAQVRGHHVREFRDDGRDNPWLPALYAQQKRLALVGAKMSIKGFPVNQKRRRELSDELRVMAMKRAKVVRDLLSPYAKAVIIPEKRHGGNGAAKIHKSSFRISMDGGVNDHDLAALIFRECAKPHIKGFNLEVPFYAASRTESKKASVDKKALLILFSMASTPEELKKIIYAVWQCDAPLKARSTFVDSKWVRNRIGPDGRMHASINTCGPETGRWSSNKPNLFNYPEAQEEDKGSLRGDMPNLREMYEAPPGWVIVHRDFKSFEVEVMAEYAGDVALRAMLDEGDVHSARTRVWFKDVLPPGCKTEDIPKMIRKQAKIVGLQSQYHAGAMSVYMSVLEQIQNAKFENIQRLHAMFPETHPGIASHWEESLSFAESHGYNETAIMHRRRYYPEGEDLLDTETSNYPIQGTAADIANSAMVGVDAKDYERKMFRRLEKEYPTAWLAMHTYDSFDVICEERHRDGVAVLMDECMSGPWKVGRVAKNFLSDLKIDRSWGKV